VLLRSAGRPGTVLDALSSASSGGPLSDCSSFRHWHLAPSRPLWPVVMLVAAVS